MTDDTLDLNALREIAEKATPGPWYTSGHPWFREASGVLAGSPDPHVGYMIADCEVWSGEREEYRDNDGPTAIGDADDDAAHIAAFNPAVALSLLDRISALEAELERVKAERDEARRAHKYEFDCHMKTAEALRTIGEQRKAAEARLAEAIRALADKEPT